MTSIYVDVDLVCTLLEVGAIVEDAYRNRLVLVVYLADCRCYHLVTLEVEENHIFRR